MTHSQSENHLCVLTPNGKTSKCCALCPTLSSGDTIVINISKPCKLIMNIDPDSTSRGCDCSKCPQNIQSHQSPKNRHKKTHGK